MDFQCPVCGATTPVIVIETRGFFHIVEFACSCGASGRDEIAVAIETKSFLGSAAAVVMTAPVSVATAAPAKSLLNSAALPVIESPARCAPEISEPIQPKAAPARPRRRKYDPEKYREACHEYHAACETYNALRIAHAPKALVIDGRERIALAQRKCEMLKPLPEVVA